MNNSLSKIRKEIKHFIKKNKTVKYSQALLVTFLISGGLGIASETDISKVANQISTKIKEERRVNKKKLNTSKIELLQLEEQGDQVVKSPWSSWQFSADYTYADMGNTIKGTDDKANLYNERYTSGNNGKLSRLLGADNKPMWWITKVTPGSATYDQSLLLYGSLYSSTFGTTMSDSSSTDQYGITQTKVVYDEKAEIAISAKIKITPPTPNVGTINVDEPSLNLPTISPVVNLEIAPPAFPGVSVIEFQPVTPNLVAPTPVTVTPISLSFGSSLNSDHYWFHGHNPLSSTRVNNAMIGQYSMGTATVGTKGKFESIAIEINTINHYINNTSMNAYRGGHTTIVGGELRTENNERYSKLNVGFASMNLVGGEIIPITNMEITHLRESTANLALFHIDAHNEYGSSIWALDNTDVTLKGNNAILFDIQYHSGVGDAGMSFDNGVIRADSSTSYTSTYNGTTYNSPTPGKRYIFVTIQASGGSLRHLFFRNEANGNIYLNGIGDTLANLAANVNSGNGFGGSYIENRGRIELNGVGSMGVVIAHTPAMANGLHRSWIRFEEPLILNGDKSVGVAFTRNFNTNAFAGADSAPNHGEDYETPETKDSVLKITIGERTNGFDSGGEAANGDDTSIIGHTPTLVEEATALYFNNGSTTKTPYVIEEIELNALKHAKKATLITLIDGNVTLNNNSVFNNILNINGGATKTGVENIAIYVGPTVIANATLVNNVPITITNSDSSTAIFGQRADITNNGSITIAGSNGVKGVIADASSNITIAGNVTLTDGGVYTNSANIKIGSVVLGSVSGSTLTASGTVTADVSGQESIGLYSNGNSILSLTGSISNIKASDSAFAMTAINGGNIKYSGGILEAGQKSLLFFVDNNISSKIEILGATTATIRGASDATDRGTAFYYKSTTAYSPFGTTEINAYFANRFGGTLGALTLNMEEGSRLFIADSVTMNLSNTNLSMGGVTGAPVINPLGSSYKSFMLYQSDLTIDQNVNLDLITDDYNKLEIVGSRITLNALNTITGNLASQVAIAQENGLDSLGALEATNKVILTNNGNINLTGLGSTGIYASHGEINNTGTLSVGEGSLGIYSIKGTLTNNTGTINIGENSVGIYATNDGRIPSKPIPTGGNPDDKTINVINNGNIVGAASAKGFGIYMDNKETASSNLNLGGSSNIDLSLVNSNTLGESVGLYVNRTTVASPASGTITVGKNGIGIMALDSNLTMNNLTLNLNGDNAVAIQLSGTSTFNGTGGTININGQNITLFNLASGVTLNQNFNIVALGGSTYSYGSVMNSQIYSNTPTTIGGGKTFLNGKNTAAYYDTNSNITSNGDNSMGMVLDGAYGALPIIGGVTPLTDGTNIGTISLNNKSMGLYAENGAGLHNKGIIEVGIESAGIYVNTGGNAALIKNDGNIKVGTESIGMYGINTRTMTNDTGAEIKNSQNTDASVIGMRLNSSVATGIFNNGNINLVGSDKLIGIYSESVMTTSNTITNDGNINISNATQGNSNVGIYSKNKNDTIINNGNISVGNGGIGIYGKDVTLGGISSIAVGDKGIGIYSEGGIINLSTSNISVGTEGIIVYGKDGVNITDNTSTSIGNNSFGFILEGTGASAYTNTAGNISMGGNSIYVYSTTNSNITNNANIQVSGSDSTIIYGTAGVITNNGTLDLSNGINNIGIYSDRGAVSNNAVGVVTVGAGSNDKYGIGLAVENGAALNNKAQITLTGDKSIGIFANGIGTTVNNTGNIYLSPAASTEITQMIGIYADNKSTVVNYGNIETSSDYSSHGNKTGMYGMVIKNGSTLENHGNITIQANSSSGIYLDKAIIKNYGNITVQGSKSAGLTYVMNSDTKEGFNNQQINPSNETDVNGGAGSINTYEDIDPSATGKQVGNIVFEKDANGNMASFVNGSPIPETPGGLTSVNTSWENIAKSGVGIYIDTLGNTNPLKDEEGNFLASNPNSIIIGAEIASQSNDKTIMVSGNVTDRFLNDASINNADYSGGIYSGSLLWVSTLVYDTDSTSPTYGTYSRVLLQKVSFTEFAGDQDVTNFAIGIDQLYDVAHGTRDKEVFNKLNDIGANEKKVLFQAYDEMMGQPYANTQQRIMASGSIIDKGIDNLFKWDTASKQSNKVQAIGGRSNYKTNTAGVVDYKQTSGGVVYLNEHETVKLGNASGWYAGLLQSRFDFDDIGESKEDATIGKMGVYKSTSFDNNDSLNWKIKGDISGGYHKMNRKFFVVDEVYNAKGDYYSYGMNITNEISKDFRVSKNVKVGALASLELGYGQFTDIKEDKGEIKLEVKGNDYYSIKPAIGGRISFDKKVGTALTFKTELLAVVEQELGKVTNVENQAKVANTTADYFNLRKDKREKTNGKIGLNLELGTSRFGFNINGEYNTEGENSQIGAGFKFVF